MECHQLSAEARDLKNNIEKVFNSHDNITCRNAYGSLGFYVGEKIFLVLTKQGRLAIKKYHEEGWEKLSDAEDWSLNGKNMEGWILLPQKYNTKRNKLTPWVELAFSQATTPRRKKKFKNHRKKKQVKAMSTKKMIQDKKQQKPHGIGALIKRIFKIS